ncbi:hypothetical protein HBA55_29010 [Pseudomaricurvus alkylphenolicus]|uniref:hypothetical protein n=1 Tax=Pseudomaricurvus alkylphenolicus TaxID=1306991 RepID=UPI00141F5C12|nr:hypothetical protein [Pseudomaricurvus alkylphenolicus]NIB43684.1 hypothetical protein [Pseudomaricurvus alkylphenolicus]
MPTPVLMNRFSNSVRPYRAKILIIGLLAFLGLTKYFLIPHMEGKQPSDEYALYVTVSGILFMWCAGILMASHSCSQEDPGLFGKLLPTFRKLGAWYASIFWFAWFVFLCVVSAQVIYGTITG